MAGTLFCQGLGLLKECCLPAVLSGSVVNKANTMFPVVPLPGAPPWGGLRLAVWSECSSPASQALCFGVRIGFFVKQAFPLTTLLAPACWAVGTHHDVLWVTMSMRDGLPAFVGEMGRGQEPLRLWGMTDQGKPEDRLLLHSLDPFYKVLIPIIGRARGFAL